MIKTLEELAVKKNFTPNELRGKTESKHGEIICDECQQPPLASDKGRLIWFRDGYRCGRPECMDMLPLDKDIADGRERILSGCDSQSAAGRVVDDNIYNT
jgi:hypothetical protein